MAEVPLQRPNTILPEKVLHIDSEQLRQMSNEQLREFAETYCGIVFPPDVSRGTLYTKIVNSSLGVIEGI